jgi:hypothetical protein
MDNGGKWSRPGAHRTLVNGHSVWRKPDFVARPAIRKNVTVLTQNCSEPVC